jgi:hypothetical protein
MTSLTDATTVTVTREDSDLRFLEDYCPVCNPLGHHQPDRGVRMTSLTVPTSVTWSGGKRLLCEYRCARCGHDWTRDDLWTAECASFVADYLNGTAA